MMQGVSSQQIINVNSLTPDHFIPKLYRKCVIRDMNI